METISISFADNDLPEEQIKPQIEETFQWLKDNTEK